jgi:hypothetical protein
MPSKTSKNEQYDRAQDYLEKDENFPDWRELSKNDKIKTIQTVFFNGKKGYKESSEELLAGIEYRDSVSDKVEPVKISRFDRITKTKEGKVTIRNYIYVRDSKGRFKKRVK